MLKIVNWNLCSFNKDQKRTLKKALSFQADINFFQEVQPAVLKFLEIESNYHLNYVSEKIGKEKDGYYLVIVSKKTLKNSHTIEYYRKNLNSPVANFLNRRSGEIENHKSLLTEFKADNGKSFYLCNVHLSWPVGPHIRIKQFQNLLNKLPDPKKTILCGDFNTFGSLKYYNLLLSWFFRYNIKEIFIDERQEIDNLIRKYKFQNPFQNTRSYKPINFNAQLDHILIPEEISINKIELNQQAYGSDHKPQTVLLDI